MSPAHVYAHLTDARISDNVFKTAVTGALKGDSNDAIRGTLRPLKTRSFPAPRSLHALAVSS